MEASRVIILLATHDRADVLATRHAVGEVANGMDFELLIVRDGCADNGPAAAVASAARKGLKRFR
jgi:hypothetical protein